MKNTRYILTVFILGLTLGAGGTYILVGQGGLGSNISRLKVIGEGKPNENVLYTNEQYDFSFRYPQGLIFEEFEEKNGAHTIVFQKPDDVKTSFQIYITPYEESTITGDRILYDASGPVTDLKEENIREDFLAATFISEAPILGKTREIWWLHGGYLFEVTTYASLDTWIRDIIKTVEFKK
ncbi:MAG: hypothetical protein Q8O71_01060 [bacterium]|nr:hypothetical protein [bacterium]